MKIIKRIMLLLLIIVIIAAAYFGIRFYSNNMETKTMNAEARKNISGQFIQLTGGITHYQSGGPDTGKVVILVHGFSVPYYIWDGPYDSLVNHGFHVIRYDEFGRGYSDLPSVKYDALLYRTQLADLIDSLHLNTPVSLIGVSFGGPVVTDFAAHYPERIDKIILSDPLYRMENLTGSEFLANYKLALDHEKQATGQLDDFKYPEHFPDWVARYKVQMQYKGFRHALISTRKYFFADSIIADYQQLGKLNKKVLLIWGKDDHTVPLNYGDSVSKLVANDFFPVDDAAHLPYLEQPTLVDAKIISFLRE